MLMDAPSLTRVQQHTSPPRHICVVTETYPPEINGVASTLARLVDGLLAQGHAVSVVRLHQQPAERHGDRHNLQLTLVRGLPLPGYKGLPNSPPPNDAVLLTSAVRQAQDSTSGYAQWLRDLRQVCTAYDIPLIFDEVYTGFRLAPGGAQEFFGVQADMVVYGKTVAGGLPIGVVCGKSALMWRFDPQQPMRIAYVAGTFSAHPAVMGAMNEFLRWVVQPEAARLYWVANQRCVQWVCSTNHQLANAALPVRVIHLATVWTVLFKAPSRYNWLLQYYLRAEQVTLSWVGTGRCLSSLDFRAANYQALQTKLLNAAHTMKSDGWWLNEQEQPGRDKKMRSRLIWEMLGSIIQIPKPLSSFYAEVMRRKKDDHHTSHSHLVNQFFHIVSSSAFLYCYVVAFFNLTTAMRVGLAALFVRQFGHAILEPPCHDKEAVLLILLPSLSRSLPTT
jgi:glutamate-1-semialdehyde 2,1-aminomutase